MKGIGGNVTAIIQTSATTTNEIGEQVQHWTDAATLSGWLDLSGGDSKYSVYNAKVQDSTHVFVADYQRSRQMYRRKTAVLSAGESATMCC